ncbi:hypothetical protein TL16_g08461 [Triparma laevis f. inornata]|uniref:Uncharacterized protein n=1 Tax=Triparma laevis f. inornata TaxID=1714386 RepID=A0A9W7EGH2_9STRA|nr:hypothetical protein TL16_g08461 [Triparma laevis f. inornata]
MFTQPLSINLLGENLSQPPPPPHAALPSQQHTIVSTTLSTTLGNLITIFIIGTLYLNYLIFLPHLPVLLVSYVMSSVLRRHKAYINSFLKTLDEDEETKSKTILNYTYTYLLNTTPSPKNLLDLLISQPYMFFITITCFKLSTSYFFFEFVVFTITASTIVLSSFAFLKVKIYSIFAYRYLFTDDSFSTFLSLSFMLSAVLFTITVLTTQCIYETALTVKHVSNFLHEEIGGDVANKVDDVVRHGRVLLEDNYYSLNESHPYVVNFIDNFHEGGVGGVGGEVENEWNISAITNINFTEVKQSVLNIVKNVNITQLKEYSNYGSVGTAAFASSVLTSLKTIGFIFEALSGGVVKIIIFVSFLLVVLQMNMDPLERVFADLSPHPGGEKAATKVNSTLGAVLLLPFDMAACHSCVFYLYLFVFRQRFPFVAVLLSFLQVRMNEASNIH